MATSTHKPRVQTFERYRWVETGVTCPGCNQQISCDLTDQPGALECGGPGEGICNESRFAFDLGSINEWARQRREFSDEHDGAKAPTIALCERISAAFDKADNVGKPYLAKANPRRR